MWPINMSPMTVHWEPYSYIILKLTSLVIILLFRLLRFVRPIMTTNTRLSSLLTGLPFMGNIVPNQNTNVFTLLHFFRSFGDDALNAKKMNVGVGKTGFSNLLKIIFILQEESKLWWKMAFSPTPWGRKLSSLWFLPQVPTKG